MRRMRGQSRDARTAAKVSAEIGRSRISGSYSQSVPQVMQIVMDPGRGTIPGFSPVAAVWTVPQLGQGLAGVSVVVRS